MKMKSCWENGYVNVMLYGFTIGGIQNLLQKGRCKVVVMELDLSLEIFMNCSLWKTNCRHNVISL